MITHDPRWTDEVLDTFRQIGDPIADQTIDEIFASGNVSEVNRLLQSLVRNDMPLPEQFPPALQNYFDMTDCLPEWADLDAIARSQKFFMQHGLLGMMILTCYSLPLCYGAAKGVQVIYQSTHFYNNPRRRVLETSQFLVDTLAPGGLTPSGSGIRSIQKVRLMHAAIRALLVKRGWDSVDLGIPINQEDMVGTLSALGFYFLDGLQKINIYFSKQEADDYIHTWNVIGHILGIQHSLMPKNFEEAAYLGSRIDERHFAWSHEGQVLQESLTGYLQETIPSTTFHGLAIALTRHFMGQERANIIRLPHSDWTQLSLGPLLLFNKFLSNINQEIPPFADVLSHFSQKLMENLLAKEQGDVPTSFHIPKNLRDAWKMNEKPAS